MKVPEISYNLDSPIYNVRILRSYIYYLQKKYPEVDIDQILNYIGVTRLQYNDFGYWCTQRQMDHLPSILIKLTGDTNIAREAGRNLMVSQNLMALYILGFKKPETVLPGLAKVYSKISLGSKISYKEINNKHFMAISKPMPGVKENPFQCENRWGSLEGIFELFLGKYPKIEHLECVNKGDDACCYSISWNEPSTQLKLGRIRNHSVVIGSLVTVLVLGFFPVVYGLFVAVVSLLLILGLSHYLYKYEKEKIQFDFSELCLSSDEYWQEINLRYSITELMQEIGKATSFVQQENDIISVVLEIIKTRLDFSRGAMLMLDSDSENLIYKAGFGFNEEAETVLNNLKFRLNDLEVAGVVMEVFHTQEPKIIEDLDKIADTLPPGNLKIAKQLNITSMICVPCVYEGKSLGILVVDNLMVDRPFMQGDINILTAVASQTAISIIGVRAYQDLRASEEKHRGLVESINDIVFTLDLEGNFTYLSPTVETIAGWKVSDLLGMHFHNAVSKTQHRTADIFFKKLLQRGTFTGELVIRANDGGVIPCEIATSVIKDALDKPIGFIGVARDISQRLSRECERKNMVVRSLSQAKFISMGEIALNLAQEVHQPLLNIGIMIDSLKKNIFGDGEISQDTILRDLEITDKQIGRASKVIEHLANYSHGDASVFTNISLPRVIKDTTTIMQERLNSSGIELRLNVQPGLPLIYGNAVKLEQVFICLIQNSTEALDGQEKKEIHIEVGMIGIEIFIKYTDNGPGISPNNRVKIFEPFYTTKDIGKGTGIGLSIVYSVMNEHGGFIECEDSKSGAFFNMRLPHLVGMRTEEGGGAAGDLEEEVVVGGKEEKTRLSVSQISKILGISYVAVNNRANKEEWAAHPVKQRGGVTRYFYIDEIKEPTKTRIMNRMEKRAH